MHSLLLAWASWVLALLLPPQQADVAFYNEHMVVSYRPELLANGPLALTEVGISHHYAAVTEGDWLPLHLQLEAERQRLRLNDWLYFKLVHETVGSIAGFAHANERRVLELHLLTLAGYDTRLCYDGDAISVYVHTNDALYEVPMIREGDRRYVNLTAALYPHRRRRRDLRMHPLRPLPGGTGFDFALDELPRLAPNVSERVFRFRYGDEHLTVHGLSDRTIAAWMSEYPFFEEGRYMSTPLSPATGERLLGELRGLLRDRSERESLELLAAFTRSAFVYKEDKVSFGFSKPMIADEVLYYPVSDCEDRSALYFTLVRELLDLPVLAIAYDDHLSIAVGSRELEGWPFVHEGRRYYVCDPTGPAGTWNVGAPPNGYTARPFEVVASYLPQERRLAASF